jgi:prepilin-type processing-associated H-X9-DG protein
LPTQSSAKNAFGTQMATTPVSSLYCPSRRAVKLYQYNYQSYPQYAVNWNNSNTAAVARCDYAANGGDNGTNDGGAFLPATIADGMNPLLWPDTSKETGIGFYRSELPMSAIKDGTSCTYLFGEKYLNPDSYANGSDPADNEVCYVGWDNDIFRITASTSVSGSSVTVNNYFPPLQDTAGNLNSFTFGSAHFASFNISFCDGSVRSISYSIDQETHRLLSNRLDGKMLDPSKY